MNSLHVGMEIPFLRKGSWTKGTGVGLFTCMLDHVSLQRPLLVKGFSTLATFKGPFTCVDPDMPSQLARLLERLATVWA